MIENYKIVSGKYNPFVALTVNKGSSYITRGNDQRLQKSLMKFDPRKYCFTKCVVNMWNSRRIILTYLKTDWITIGDIMTYCI